MFVIQFLDHEEGSCARWYDVTGARFENRDDARRQLMCYRNSDDEWCLYSYRITEEGSDAYFSQPTDALEY